MTSVHSLCFEQASLGELQSTSVEFGPGLHVIHCPDGIGIPAFFELAAGLVAPRRGLVSLRARSPFTSPELRAHLGTRLPEERLPEASDVPQSLRRMGLRSARLEAVLTLGRSLGVTTDDRTKTAHLTAPQRAAWALAIALTTTEPWALVLHEPLCHLTSDAQSQVQDRLLSLSDAIPVVVVTASLAQGERLGGSPLSLCAGILRAQPAGSSGWFGMEVKGLGLRELTAELSRHPAIRDLHWLAEWQGQETLRFETHTLEDASRMIARASRDLGLKIHSLCTRSLPL